MSQNPSRRAFYCDLTSGYTGDDGVVNEAVPLFVEYYNLTIRDEHMVEEKIVGESVLMLIPEYFDLNTWQFDGYDASDFRIVGVV